MRKFAISLGANLPSPVGPPVATLRKALDLMAEAGLVLQRFSGFFRTPAYPSGSGPDYANAAVLVASDRAPETVLQTLLSIENRLGRTRTQRWEARVADLDLLFCDGEIVPDSETLRRQIALSPVELATSPAVRDLILPHPRLQDRAFVLVPLERVAADWEHPVLRRSVTEMLAALPAADRACIVEL